MSPEAARLLLDWYAANRRILPWREDPTPYHVWLSEIMLQQTRVEAVKNYYRKFLETLPDIPALAAAPEEVYLKLWEGLGYYSRVRNLHRAAEKVMADYGGELPHTASALKQLPGIGDYTAAAIASIAYGEPVPAVDGNLLRVYARLALYRDNIKDRKAFLAAHSFYGDAIPAGEAGAFNQALMDLGAMVCLPNTAPRCDVCPLRDHCGAHREGAERALPVMPGKKERRVVERTVFLIRSGSRTAIQKRPERGLLAGMYEFPGAEKKLSREEAAAWLKKKGVPALRIRELPFAKHIFTHREWHMTGYEVLVGSADEDRVPYIMAENSEITEQYSVPSAFAAYMKELTV